MTLFINFYSVILLHCLRCIDRAALPGSMSEHEPSIGWCCVIFSSCEKLFQWAEHTCIIMNIRSALGAALLTYEQTNGMEVVVLSSDHNMFDRLLR